MNGRIILALSASAMAFAMGMGSCVPQSIAKSGDAVSANSKRAATAAAKAEKLLAKGKTEQAVMAAEEAVSYDLRNPDMRALLGRAYLADGRLKSAEQAFRDTLTLQPQHPGATLSLALVRVALGDSDEARRILMDAEGLVSDSDRGLGLALAGDYTVAIPLLQSVVREDAENVKARQNLAFAFAMNGQWREARSVAGYDLGPGQVADRIGEWAQIAQPANSYDQVAYLLGIRPVQDAGQPTRLALGPVSGNVQLASAPEAILPVTQYYPPVEAAQEAAPAPVVEAAPAPVVDAEAPAAVGAGELPAPGLETIDTVARPAITYVPGEIVQKLLPEPVKPSAPAFASAGKVKMPASSTGTGKYVVQIGAFSSPKTAQAGWNKTVSQNPSLSDYTPISSNFRPKGGKSFVRLSIGGFDNRGTANQACSTIKSKGGVCFVRAVTSDAVPKWAKGGNGTKLARR